MGNLKPVIGLIPLVDEVFSISTETLTREPSPARNAHHFLSYNIKEPVISALYFP